MKANEMGIFNDLSSYHNENHRTYKFGNIHIPVLIHLQAIADGTMPKRQAQSFGHLDVTRQMIARTFAATTASTASATTLRIINRL